MDDKPLDFDLKFLPDWLKEEPGKNAYADYKGEDEERPRRDFTKPKPRQRDQKPKGKRPPDSRQHRQQPEDRPAQGHIAPKQSMERSAPVKIEFLPELHCSAALAKQIKSSARAYPLFDLARMFLEKPDRHRVKITAADPAVILHQCGDEGPVALDRELLERNAFPLAKHLFYSEEVTQGDPPKGNYSSVARCRLSGTLLGPTNHHGYQPALRKLYDERFSRRMPFADYQREIELVSDPSAVEAWKDQSRSVTTYKTLQEPEPVAFASAAEAERHFRAHYLEKSLRSGNAFEISGVASRSLPDRNLSGAVRQAWEGENRFPGHLMNHLRHEFIHAGLYIFKHRNRVQLVSAIRPVAFGEAQQTLSDLVAEILKVIASIPKCTRAELAAKILAGREDDPAKLKSQLASDLHWLTHAGHVIELNNGILELPLPPSQNPPAPSKKHDKKSPIGAAAPEETSPPPMEPVPVPGPEAALQEPGPVDHLPGP